MAKTKKTYVGWKELGYRRKQTEYSAPTRLLDDKGNLTAQGWARRNVFDYRRADARPQSRGKEWDFYQLSDGKYMVQIVVANISIGGYASLVFADVSGEEEKLINSTVLWLGGKNKVILPENGDRPNRFEFSKKGYSVLFDTGERKRTIAFRGNADGKPVNASFEMDLMEDHQNITIVTPFRKRGKAMPKRFFLTMKQNCMPCEGTFSCGDFSYTFSKENTFCVLDWGRGVWPYRNVWYWGNGAQRIRDEAGNEHIFGFEITWGIGNEDHATETCLFLDGVAHKIGSVDVETFPKPDKYMQPWHFLSEDGRFDLTMTPQFDHHTDMNFVILRMHSHQVHGRWNGTVVLDDGTKLEIRNMYAFCEYVENRW